MQHEKVAERRARAAADRRRRSCRASGCVVGSRKPSSGASSVASSASTSPRSRRRRRSVRGAAASRSSGLDVGQREKDLLGERDAVRHADRRPAVRRQAGRAARYSQARANAHSFLTVAGDRSSALAVSSTLSPAKYRSATILRLARIDLFEPRQRLVDGDEIGRAPDRRAAIALIELDVLAAGAVLDALIVAGALDEDAPHRQRGGGKEMAAAIPLLRSDDRRRRADTLRGRARWAAVSGCG